MALLDFAPGFGVVGATRQRARFGRRDAPSEVDAVESRGGTFRSLQRNRMQRLDGT